MTRYPFESMMPKQLEAYIKDDKLVLRSEYEHKLGIEMIPGSRKAGRGQDWWGLPISYTSFRLLDSIFPNHVLDDEAAKVKAQLSETANAVRGLRLTPELHTQIRKLMGHEWVRDYQIDGAVYLGTVRGGALLDEPGLGKTVTVAVALKLYDDTMPALVVCPKSVLISWQRELSKLGINSTILYGDAAKRRKIIEAFDPDETPVMITTYEMVKAYSRISSYGTIKLDRCTECAPSSMDDVPVEKCDVHERELNRIPWRTVVVDEAHRIGNPKTEQTRAIWGVARGATYRWAMTATPMEQSMVEFWSLLHFLDPDEWSTSTKYRDRWALQHTNYFGVTEVLGLRPDTAQEFDDVTGWRWIRRIMDRERMPERITEYCYCELSPKEAKPYKTMSKQLMAELPFGTGTEVVTAENHMVKTGYLLRLSSGMLEVVDHRTEDDGRVVPICGGIEPSSKLDLMMEKLVDLKGHPVIIWFHFRDTIRLAADRMAAAGYTFVVVDGSKSIQARQDAVDAFQNGEVDYILLTDGAGAEGITLTRSRIALHVERPWSSRVNTQLDGRHFRIGSEIHETVLDINLVTRGTVEEDLYAAQDEKAENVQEVLRDYQNRSV